MHSLTENIPSSWVFGIFYLRRGGYKQMLRKIKILLSNWYCKLFVPQIKDSVSRILLFQFREGHSFATSTGECARKKQCWYFAIFHYLAIWPHCSACVSGLEYTILLQKSFMGNEHIMQTTYKHLEHLHTIFKRCLYLGFCLDQVH